MSYITEYEYVITEIQYWSGYVYHFRRFYILLKMQRCVLLATTIKTIYIAKNVSKFILAAQS